MLLNEQIDGMRGGAGFGGCTPTVLGLVAKGGLEIRTWLWVKTLETPGEHQNRWYMGVHLPQHGGIVYDPWPFRIQGFGITSISMLPNMTLSSVVFSE